MDLSSLNAILLIALSVPIVMHYRILPINGTPYWLFGILFFLLAFNLFISLNWIKINQKFTHLIKNILLSLILVISLGGPAVTNIVDRARSAPNYGVHDIILQQEAAMRYLLEGKNPYSETYFGTPVKLFKYEENGQTAVNPALYHFVMPPWYLIFPFGFYFLSIPALGYFDGRIALIFCLAALLLVIYRWFKNKDLARLAIILTAIAPGTVDYFLEGRSDMFALFWLIWSLYLLDKRKFFWSGIIFALAILSKQTVWFIAPFMLIYLLYKERSNLWKFIIPSVVTFLVLVTPFMIWNSRAFIDSTILYLSGSTANAYPVSGYGWGMVLANWNIIKDIHAYYPFWIWQLIIAVPLMIYFLIKLRQKQIMSNLIIGYGLFLFIFWYFSRYFNNSHLSYLSGVFILGIIKQNDESKHETG